MSKRAVIYCRISQDRTGQQAGVERQEEACRALALARGWTVTDVEVDNSISASTGKHRPAWQAVLQRVERREVDVVIAWHLDRITRTMIELEELILLAQDAGVGVATATGDIDLTTDTGQMVARILAAVARAEVDRKAARQRAANDQRAQKGRPQWTRRPFGYNRDGTLHRRESRLLRAAYRDVIAKQRPLKHIADEWNRLGALTTLGNTWHSGSVRQLLLNPRNRALNVLRGETVGVGNWTPMVDEDMFNAAVNYLTRPNRRPGGGARKAMLTGIAECGKCGSFMLQITLAPKADGTRPRMYTCRRNRCVTIPADQLDSIVTRRVLDRVAEWSDMLPSDDSADAAQFDELRVEKVAKEAARAALLDLLGDGTITALEFRQQNERIGARIGQIEARLAQGVVARLGVQVNDIEALWEWSGNAELFRPVVQRVCSEIRVMPRGAGARSVKQESVVTTFR